MGNYKVRELTDKNQILSFLERDRLYAAYAIGDLEPELFAQCSWIAAERSGEMRALALLFRGLDPPALFLMGEIVGLRSILLRAPFPREVFFTCLPEHLAMTRHFYAWEEPIAMWRMVLNAERFRAVGGECVRLTPKDVGELTKLYAEDEEGGTGFNPQQIQKGVFYGLHLNDQLVSVGGTHLVSKAYGVAAVGNIFTLPQYRSKGYATAATSAVLTELVEWGIEDIVLNVSQDNAPAVSIYDKLGFERYCTFYEGLGSMGSL
jgi:ribosomal protein S18 acetylase RimI-like enzyme